MMCVQKAIKPRHQGALAQLSQAQHFCKHVKLMACPCSLIGHLINSLNTKGIPTDRKTIGTPFIIQFKQILKSL